MQTKISVNSEGEGMERVEFSEMTNRLRRNLMGSAFLIMVIVGFNIRVGKATALGMELENLTTEVVLTVLVAFLCYHTVAFAIRAFEEYRIWELKLADKQASYWGGGIGIVELADRMKTAAETLEKIIANGGTLHEGKQEILTASDANQLKLVSNSALIYGRRLRNFPKVTRFRFWFWDIGLAATVVVIASLFTFSILPPGVFNCW